MLVIVITKLSPRDLVTRFITGPFTPVFSKALLITLRTLNADKSASPPLIRISLFVGSFGLGVGLAFGLGLGCITV